MKEYFIAMLLFALGAASTSLISRSYAGDTPNKSTNSPGRFQLFQGKYLATVIVKGESKGGAMMDELFKIDTETGETWSFIACMEDGKLTRGWKPLPKDLP